ncbi:unnamed protein product [Acanthoscelides obtectus]|uniref:Uncharacterized protein n=1 Tax=Acanthoscelides obtectus TaxID=200917 RepID=A0A9P0L685_ACAOB|nr:unnamed protein product [Acanthoscelides obtectus]CAK1630970.1 hypothetical protein AOBTE_LOCUS6682 [Acanthoscelides obtectus]
MDASNDVASNEAECRATRVEPLSRYPPETEDLIIQAFEDDPTTSTRKVAADLGKLCGVDEF